MSILYLLLILSIFPTHNVVWPYDHNFVQIKTYNIKKHAYLIKFSVMLSPLKCKLLF